MTARPVLPGITLRAEMRARKLSANTLAVKLGVPTNRITEILRGRRAITAVTAMRLGRFFGNSAEFWMNLQKNYEMAVARQKYADLVMVQVAPLP